MRSGVPTAGDSRGTTTTTTTTSQQQQALSGIIPCERGSPFERTSPAGRPNGLPRAPWQQAAAGAAKQLLQSSAKPPLTPSKLQPPAADAVARLSLPERQKSSEAVASSVRRRRHSDAGGLLELPCGHLSEPFPPISGSAAGRASGGAESAIPAAFQAILASARAKNEKHRVSFGSSAEGGQDDGAAKAAAASQGNNPRQLMRRLEHGALHCMTHGC